MFLDLTTKVSRDNPLLTWAKSQNHPRIAMGHVGTHLDTYEKRPIPLTYFKSRGVLFDVRGISEVKSVDIDLAVVRKADFVLFRTGQIERIAYGDSAYFSDAPQLSHELIEALLDKGIHFIGVDCAGIRHHEEHERADRACEKAGVYVIENLCNLEQVGSGNFVVYAMWLEEEALTGLPCRVIAELRGA